MSQPDINAGAWYLRGRHDHAWDVCEPATGAICAEVAMEPDTLELTVRGDTAAANAAADAVRRFLRQTGSHSIG